MRYSRFVTWIVRERLRSTLVIVKPETVIARRRKGFKLFRTWKTEVTATLKFAGMIGPGEYHFKGGDAGVAG
jgi:hypothetical protein